MIELNKNTKKAQGFINNFIKAREQGNTSIFNIYARPSMDKMTIADKLKHLAGKDNATLYYIGGNSYTFTCGYSREVDNKTELIIFTKSYTYKIAL